MLVITRRIGERMFMMLNGLQVEVQVLDLDRGKARLGVVAPPEVVVLREELMQRVPERWVPRSQREERE